MYEYDRSQSCGVRSCDLCLFPSGDSASCGVSHAGSFWDRVQVRNAGYWVAPHNNWLYSASADAMHPSSFLLRGNRWSYVHNLCRETCCQPEEESLSSEL